MMIIFSEMKLSFRFSVSHSSINLRMNSGLWVRKYFFARGHSKKRSSTSIKDLFRMIELHFGSALDSILASDLWRILSFHEICFFYRLFFSSLSVFLFLRLALYSLKLKGVGSSPVGVSFALELIGDGELSVLGSRDKLCSW